MNIRKYRPEEVKEIANLFHQSIHNIDTHVYSSIQQEAWAPTPPDYHHWVQRLAITNPFVSVSNKIITGFIELEDEGYINCLYVHPDHQHQGIATELYHYLLCKAQQRQYTRLHVRASDIARSFFLKQGFIVLQENQVEIRGQYLRNWSMELLLT